MSTSLVDHEITGPFVMEGVEWLHCGGHCLILNPETALAAAKMLEELGFTLYRSQAEQSVIHSFTFIGSYSTPTNHYEVVTIVYISRNPASRLEWEIAYWTGDGNCKRFGEHTYLGEDQVNGDDLAKAYQAYGHENVTVQPTLLPRQSSTPS